MKTRLYNSALILFGTAFFLMVFGLLANAQTNDLSVLPGPLPDEGTVTMIVNFLAPIVAALAGKYPVIVTILAWLVLVQVIMKCVMTGVEAYVKSTPSPDDDLKIAKFEANKIYRWTVFIIDLLLRVKPPVAIKAGTTNPFGPIT